MTLSGFKDKYLGKQVEYHSYSAGAENQCVDLINQYLTEVLGLDHIIGTNAKDFKDRYNPNQLLWIPNTPEGVPDPGDIVVWNGRVGGGAGHVGIVLSGNVNSFTSLDQNWSKTERVTIENHNYSNVSGWLHPKEPMSDALQECLRQHKSLVDETVELKKEVERLRTQIERERSDFDNARNDYEERLKEAKNDFSTLVKALADTLGTNQNQEAIRAKLIELLDTMDVNKDFIRNMADVLNTTQKFTEMLAVAENLMQTKDLAKKAQDELADKELMWKQERIELEGKITKLKMDLESKDLPEDSVLLLKAAIKVFIKDVEKLLDSYKKEPRK